MEFSVHNTHVNPIGGDKLQVWAGVGFGILPENSLHKNAHRGPSNTGISLWDAIFTVLSIPS